MPLSSFARVRGRPGARGVPRNASWGHLLASNAPAGKVAADCTRPRGYSGRSASRLTPDLSTPISTSGRVLKGMRFYPPRLWAASVVQTLGFFLSGALIA